MDTLLSDLRYALRSMRKTPAFAAVLVLTVAIGTGVNATVFSFVHALLLRSADGVSDSSGLVAVYTSDYSSGPYAGSSYLDYESMRAETATFAALAAYDEGGVAIAAIGDTLDRVNVGTVSGPFFPVTGLRPVRGRLIDESDTTPSAPPVVVLSHGLWLRTFAGADGVLGRPLSLNGRVHTIVGILPPGFEGLDLGRAFDVWTPLVPGPAMASARGDRGLSIVGRLAAGVTLPQAQERLRALSARLADVFPDTNRGTRAQPDAPRPMSVLMHTRMPPAFRGEVSLIGAVLLGATTLVLIIACADVAGLLLARATARGREMAVRLALGATRPRLVRQLLTESVVLGLSGGAVGLLFSLWTVDALPSFFPPEQQRIIDARIDGAVLAFTACLAIASAALFGLAPAFQARRSSAALALRGDAGALSDARGGSRLRRALVTAQVACSCVLLVSTVLLTRSLANIVRADLGFGTRDAVLVTVEIPQE